MFISKFFQYKTSYHKESKETIIVIGEIGNWTYEVRHNSRTNEVLGYAYKDDGMYFIFDETARSDKEADELIEEACRLVESKMIDDFRFSLWFEEKILSDRNIAS